MKPGEKQDKALHLEEALQIAGSGLYTKYIIFVCGSVLFGGIANMQLMAVAIPMASCDLSLSNFEKGILTSVSFAGITLSSHLFGFLADMCGRRKIMLVCTSTSAAVSFVSSLSPNFITLSFCWFVVGFMTGGLFSPAYVYVSEFCPKEIRARGVLIASSMCALATGYLPCIAWLIMQLDIHIPLIGNLVFTSWRLFIAIFPITNLVPMFLLCTLPESPKFVLNEGKEEETLEILKTAYSINKRAPRNDYPVESVCLDTFDAMAQLNKEKGGHPLLRMLRTVVKQAIILLSRPFLGYTLVYSLMMMGILGMYNSFVLWMPQQMKLLMFEIKSNSTFTKTMCDILSHEGEVEVTMGSCNLNIDAYLPTIGVGVAQFIAFLFVSTFADKVEKKYIIVVTTGIAAAASLGLEYVHQYHLIVLCLGLIIVVLLTSYPTSLSIAVEFYPTTLRSTAASIILLCGRLAAVIFTQIFGYMYHTKCGIAYFTAAFILIGVSILAATSQSKRNEDNENTPL